MSKVYDRLDSFSKQCFHYLAPFGSFPVFILTLMAKTYKFIKYHLASFCQKYSVTDEASTAETQVLPIYFLFVFPLLLKELSCLFFFFYFHSQIEE